jgi:hypothetical protein
MVEARVTSAGKHHTEHVRCRAQPSVSHRGAHTSPGAVIDALSDHPLTNIGLERFIKDREKARAHFGEQTS